LFIHNLKTLSNEFHNHQTDETKAKQYLHDKPEELITRNKLHISKTLRWAMAVAAVFIIGFTSYEVFFNTKPSMQQMYASNYTAEKLSFERGNGDALLEKVVEDYNNKKYESVLPSLVNYATQHPENNNIKVAIGICQMETASYTEAEVSFNNLISQNDLFKEKAQWYLLMLYLRQQKKQEAVALLKQFTEGHFYFEKGKQILKALD
jgi:tetratricopeptide (TPR) repeat protein